MGSSVVRPRPSQRDRWLVSYADLMTLLFALFVVLFSAAQKRPIPAGPDRQARRAQVAGVPAGVQTDHGIPASAEDNDALYARLSNVLAPAAKTESVSVQRLPKGIVIRLNEAGSFDTAEAKPLPGMREVLEHVAAITGPTGAAIRVEGYTDDHPIHTAKFRSNWELSTARAQAVLLLLLAQPGMDPGNLSVAGYGPYHPIASNGTETGRRINRRIDLVVTPAGGQ